MLLMIVLLFGCSSPVEEGYQPPENALFTLVNSSRTGIDFVNEVKQTKDFNIFSYRNFFNGGGVAIGDINNDGLADIYFTGNQVKNRLYLNKGNLEFEDITESSGTGGSKFWSTGVTMADINADGWLDIYVCNSGRLNGGNRENELFINQRNGTFKEEAQKYGLHEPDGLSTHAAFFDYDDDGDLDCYMLNNSYRPIESFGYQRNLRHIRDEKGGDKLYRNDGGIFIDVSTEAGIYGSEIGFGLGVSVADLNNDQLPDIYVSNDFFERDYLYLNNGNGTFREVLEHAIGSISLSSMGADVADINNDGLPEIFTTDMLPESDYRLKTMTKFDHFDVFNAKLKNDFHHQFSRNMLQLNNGDGTFSEIGQLAGVYQTDWSWGALFFDFDNNGWNDLFVANGISKDLTNQDFTDYFANVMGKDKKQPLPDREELLDKISSTPLANYAFVNMGNLQFENRSDALGLAHPSFSNGAAYGDLDNDGDQDLVVNNENAPCFVYRNNSEKNKAANYLKIKLKGSGGNTGGIGAKVTVYANDLRQVREMMPSRGFQSAVEPVLHFGLRDHSDVDSLRVIWPGGLSQLLQNVTSNKTITLDQKNGKPFAIESIEREQLFEADTTQIIGESAHTENLYIDFDNELLLHSLLSLEGPKCATGDVNGDGRMDIVLGGAKGDALKILIQQTDGRLKVQTDKEIQLTRQMYEDAGLALFDVDGDGDLDLMVASGGNEPALAGIPSLQARLYLNDGRGRFKNGIHLMPAVNTNASCVRPADYDNDGDMDVFIGGRSTSGNYGKIPPSYILRNDGGGRFTDVTDQVANSIRFAGNVTDAVWADLDGNSQQELVICGEWMPLSRYVFEKGRFVNKTMHGPDQLKGWWNTIKIEDLNADGRPDIIAGNHGLNSKFRAASSQPVRLYTGDFDDNRTPESIIELYKTDGQPYPLPLRGDLIAQMPGMKKKFLLHSNYAGKTIGQVLPPEKLETAGKREVNYLETSVFINKGNDRFERVALPVEAQFTPVYAISSGDFNADGNVDLFFAGNFGGLKPELGRYDAGYGQVLLGNGQGKFEYVKAEDAGISIDGEARDAVLYPTGKGETFLLVAMNNERPRVFRVNKRTFSQSVSTIKYK